MQRRHFVASMLAAASASAVPGMAKKRRAGDGAREYYELRRYQLEQGAQSKLTNNYLSEALLPALNRLQIKPVGVFNLYLGVHLPAIYVLIPYPSAETFVSREQHLAQDDAYLRAGEPFLKATSKAPAFQRMESELMAAFQGTKLTPPPPAAHHGQRVFQLRTYENPSHQAHLRKIEMFHSGEFDVFHKAGFWPVFYGDKLIGPRLPNVTYMISFPRLSELNAKWKAFFTDPEWTKLTKDPRFNYDQIVTNINSTILTPAKYSQI
ncbi:MAG: NIPSNAP family protein [Bryobacteraceae bacterium]